ncbi:MAG: hypothetical protein OXC13_03050 [Caldilineaceae bacterium]|nr:hypothetical protein [Caldilineaceae bacterium]
MNIVSGLGILTALVVNLRQMRLQSGGESSALTWGGAHTLFYANAALAIGFFHN